MFAWQPIPFSVQLTTCGFETEDTAIVVVEGMDIREIRCRLIAEANALLAQKAAAEPLQEDDLRSMVENFNFAPRDCARRAYNHQRSPSCGHSQSVGLHRNATFGQSARKPRFPRLCDQPYAARADQPHLRLCGEL
jgi:hypothetical protein